MGVVGHAIVYTVAALPLGLGAYISLALREDPPNPCPRRPSSLAYTLGVSLAITPALLKLNYISHPFYNTSVLTRPVVNKYP